MTIYIVLLNGKIQKAFESKFDAQMYADNMRENEIGEWTYKTYFLVLINSNKE